MHLYAPRMSHFDVDALHTLGMRRMRTKMLDVSHWNSLEILHVVAVCVVFVQVHSPCKLLFQVSEYLCFVNAKWSISSRTAQKNRESVPITHLYWRRLSCRLIYLPQPEQEKVISGLLWVRSCIIKLYDFENLRWQYLQTNSHFGRILRRKSDRQSLLSIRKTANIVLQLDSLDLFKGISCVDDFSCKQIPNLKWNNTPNQKRKREKKQKLKFIHGCPKKRTKHTKHKDR